MHAEVFAVEDTAVQVCWSGAGGGPVRVAAGDHVVEGAGDVGAVVIDGLAPTTTLRVEVRTGIRCVHAGTVTTLAPPPGRRLSRFATVNDIHLGARLFGTFRPIWNDDERDPAPMRCARAAVAEALAWGAEAIVVEGDITQRGRAIEWEQAVDVLGVAGVPTLAIGGNHETKIGALPAPHALGLLAEPAALDLPGARIIAVPTAVLYHGRGWIPDHRRAAAVELVAGAPAGSAAVVAMHHYPQRFRHPTIYPAGIAGPNARQFLDAVAEAHPATIVLAGHSHRHRRHDYRGVVMAETGSTKDFPGSWAGYTVHEGGILQTTRRVMEPSAIAWTERGRRVLGGAWGVWAPGLRSHRCFAYVWPARDVAPPPA